jgi:hypothetical protein
MNTGRVVPFNPLDKKNLGASVAEALVTSKAHDLGAIPAFSGVGIYAIYYCGEFRPYQRIAQQNADRQQPRMPIYVGKAVPAGSRKGNAISDPLQSRSLYNRLSEHAESISLAENIEIDDFVCRYVIVDEIWIPLGESLLIAKFAPVWNTIVEGFGNHDPGSGRYQGLRPRWDVAHPGRAWALKCKQREETAADVLRDASSYLDNIVFPTSPHFTGQTDLL